MRGYLSYLGCPRHMLDDLTQDVFLAVIAGPFEERSREATAGYLRRVAHHLLLKALSRERQRLPEVDPVAAADAWIDFEGDDGGAGYLAALRECLQRLKGRAREVLRLRYEHAISRNDIAGQLQLSEAGVKSILVRSRRKLRTCVEARLEG